MRSTPPVFWSAVAMGRMAAMRTTLSQLIERYAASGRTHRVRTIATAARRTARAGGDDLER